MLASKAIGNPNCSLYGRLLALLANNRLGWKGFPHNTFYVSFINSTKKLVCLYTPGVNFIKHFMTVIYQRTKLDIFLVSDRPFPPSPMFRAGLRQ
jgi:hypothetical protein